MPCLRFYENGVLTTLTQFDAGKTVFSYGRSGSLVPVLFDGFIGSTALSYAITPTHFFIKISAVSASGDAGFHLVHWRDLDPEQYLVGWHQPLKQDPLKSSVRIILDDRAFPLIMPPKPELQIAV